MPKMGGGGSTGFKNMFLIDVQLILTCMHLCFRLVLSQKKKFLSL